MADKGKPPRDTSRDEPSDVDILAMTIRHGADHTKQYLNALARREVHENRMEGPDGSGWEKALAQFVDRAVKTAPGEPDHEPER